MNDSNIINNLSRLKEIRESKKVSQVKLATYLEVSQELISRYEVGAAFPQPNMLIKIANYFHCSVDYLLGLTDIPTPINYFSYNSLTKKNSELINNYNILSNEDKSHIDSYMAFLIDSYYNKKDNG